MGRYDVYQTRHKGRYLLDIQSDFITRFDTRVVAPLFPPKFVPSPMDRLHPVFEVNGDAVIMATQLMSAVPSTELGSPIASLKQYHDQIIAALDMLFTGV